jgi:hypothetical protein
LVCFVRAYRDKKVVGVFVRFRAPSFRVNGSIIRSYAVVSKPTCGVKTV